MTRPNLISDVQEFMSETDLPAPDTPTIEYAQYRPLHISEETREFVDAYKHLTHLIGVHGTARLRSAIPDTYVAAWADVAKELVDIVYTAIGCAEGLGIDFEAVWNEIHDANMRKIEYTECDRCKGTGFDKNENKCPACKMGHKKHVLKDANGKVLKPKGWTPAKLDAIIRRQLGL